MEPKRFMVRCAVHLFLVQDGKVLVEKRKNREYCNNQLDVIASHIIGNESAIDAIVRTAKVEVNIDVKKEDVKDHDSIINYLKNIKSICNDKITDLKENPRDKSTEIYNQEKKKKHQKFF